MKVQTNSWNEVASAGPEYREVGDAYLATLGPPNCVDQFDSTRRVSNLVPLRARERAD